MSAAGGVPAIVAGRRRGAPPATAAELHRLSGDDDAELPAALHTRNLM